MENYKPTIVVGGMGDITYFPMLPLPVRSKSTGKAHTKQANNHLSINV